MINRYTADRKIRSDDAYTANAEANRRPDRAVVVSRSGYARPIPVWNVVIGSIEASLRRIAHYDYWSDKVRRSVLPDSADILLFGNAERALVALTHRLAAGEPIAQIRDLRGTAFMVARAGCPARTGRCRIRPVDRPGRIDAHPTPMRWSRRRAQCGWQPGDPHRPARRTRRLAKNPPAERSAIRLPSYEQVKGRSGTLRACLAGVAPRIQPRKRPRVGAGSRGARCVAQSAADSARDRRHGLRLWPRLCAPAILRTAMHIPAWEMIRFSINIMRGCFGGCTFCSITEHEGASSRAARRPPSCARSRRSATARRVSRGISPTLAGRPPTCTGWPARIPRSNIRAGACPASIPESARTSAPTTDR